MRCHDDTHAQIGHARTHARRRTQQHTLHAACCGMRTGLLPPLGNPTQLGNLPSARLVVGEVGGRACISPTVHCGDCEDHHRLRLLTVWCTHYVLASYHHPSWWSFLMALNESQLVMAMDLWLLILFGFDNVLRVYAAVVC